MRWATGTPTRSWPGSSPSESSRPAVTRRIFLDTEWTQPPWVPGCELMWVALADEDGRAWYGISSEAPIDHVGNPFMSGVFRLISPDEPRMSRAALAAAVVDFCGEVDEFWVWIPTVERFRAFFHLDEAEGARQYARWCDVDLQMLQGLVQPWPEAWPCTVRDLCDTAAQAGVEIPPRAPNHLHPRVHAEWNRSLFERLKAAGAVA